MNTITRKDAPIREQVRPMFWEAVEYLHRRDPRPCGGPGGTLGERAAMIVLARSFGVRYSRLAEAYMLTRERVRQIEAGTLRHLHRWRSGRVPIPKSVGVGGWWWRRCSTGYTRHCSNCRRAIIGRAMYWTRYGEARCSRCGPPPGAVRRCTPVHELPR